LCQLFVELESELNAALGAPNQPSVDGEQIEHYTHWTWKSTSGVVKLRNDRPAVIISSTSWTPDENFGILLDAIVELDARLAAAHTPPALKFTFFITGTRV
jgi:beta-1,4-mannosyltransferase